MQIVLDLIFILCAYPIVRLLIYMPLKNHFNDNSNKPIIYTLLSCIIIAIILFSIAYFTTGFPIEPGSLNRLSQNYIYTFPVLIVIAIISSIFLLVQNRSQSSEISQREQTKEMKSESTTPPSTKDESSLENIFLIILLIGIGIFILFVGYFVWAIYNT